MKKHIFTLALLAMFSTGFGQQSLKELITGENGMSNHFTRLEAEDQIAFDPRQAQAALGLDPSCGLVLQNIETDQAGFIHYRYLQTYKNLPVENSMFIAHTQDGKLAGLSGEIITDFDNAVALHRSAGSVSAKQAIDNAIKYVGAKRYAWQDSYMEKSLKEDKKDPAATFYPAAQLVWYSTGESIDPHKLRLAWKVDVYALQPLRSAYYYVDAQSGKILGTKSRLFYSDATGTANTAYSGSQVIHSDFNGSTYRLRDLTKGNGIITLNFSSGTVTDYTSTSANWNLTGADRAAMDAHYGVSQTYSFYRTVFNRNSYDNKGAAMTSRVNYPSLVDNAFWDPGTSTMNFGTSSNTTASPGGVTGIDVTGHELTHAVTQTTSALVYSKEPGAINESMSDIMGKSVQFWSKPTDTSWKISNDMNWIIRNMANPNEQRQPDTYKGTYWITTSADEYGVHTNSGVGNFMFYLLVKGGSGTNDLGKTYKVKGIGLSKADQILYRTNTVYLTPNSQYTDWRVACINAAKDLYSKDTSVLASVQNAWYAVGVGKAAGDTSCDVATGLYATRVTNKSADLVWTASDALTYNLKWKLATATTWNTINGLKGTTCHLKGLSANKAYQFLVKSLCNASSTLYSKPVTFTTSATADSVAYCASAGELALFEYIDAVSIGAINNASGNNAGYGNYTGLTADLTKGVANPITLTPAFTLAPLPDYWTVYVDYNQDGDFNDSAETVFSANSSTVVNGSFTIPATAKTGSTRMRVQLQDFLFATFDPCADIFSGEVEDYTINISAAPHLATDYVAGFMQQGSASLLKISPNPVTSSGASVSYSAPGNSSVRFSITDIYGRIVQTVSPDSKGAGSHTFRLDNLGSLAPGTYIIAMFCDNMLSGRSTFIVTK